MHHRSHDQGGLCPGRVSVWESLSRGVSVQGSLSRKVSVQGVSVHEGLCPGVPVQEGLCPGGLCLGGSLSGRPPYGNVRAVRIILECILVTDKV